jgi:hypothetical protein
LFSLFTFCSLFPSCWLAVPFGCGALFAGLGFQSLIRVPSDSLLIG